MKNCIEIEFNRGIFKAFWRYERQPKMLKDYDCFIFPAATKEQADQRANDFRMGTGEFKNCVPHPSIEEIVFL